MIAGGDFPIRGAGTVLRHGTPRVADGVLHLDEEGFVRFATPNARSCFHRLGIGVDMRDCLNVCAIPIRWRCPPENS